MVISLEFHRRFLSNFLRLAFLFHVTRPEFIICHSAIARQAIHKCHVVEKFLATIIHTHIFEN